MALLNCPECGRLVSDRAVTCPSCGYPFKPSSLATPSVPAPLPIEEVENTDLIQPSISRTRHVAGILLNVFIGGSGWLLAPEGQRWPGIFFFGLWLIVTFSDLSFLGFDYGLSEPDLSLLLTACLNIFLAYVFGSYFNKYVWSHPKPR